MESLMLLLGVTLLVAVMNAKIGMLKADLEIINNKVNLLVDRSGPSSDVEVVKEEEIPWATIVMQGGKEDG